MSKSNLVVAALVFGLSAVVASPALAQVQLDHRCSRAIENEVRGRYPQAESVDSLATRGNALSQYEIVYSGAGHFQDQDGARTPFLFECISSARTGTAYGVRIRGAGEPREAGAPLVLRDAPAAAPRSVAPNASVVPSAPMPVVRNAPAAVSGVSSNSVSSNSVHGAQPAGEVLGTKDSEAPVDPVPAEGDDVPIASDDVLPRASSGPLRLIEPAAETAAEASAAPARAIEASVVVPEAIAPGCTDDTSTATCNLPPQPLVQATALSAVGAEPPPPLPGTVVMGPARAPLIATDCETLMSDPAACSRAAIEPSPASVEAPDQAPPIEAALSRVARDLPQGQIEVLRFAAHATTAASVCPNMELNNQAIVGTLSNVVQAMSVTLSPQEVASRRDSALVAYGVLTGLMLNDAAADKDAFCAAAARNAGDAGSWSFVRIADAR